MTKGLPPIGAEEDQLRLVEWRAQWAAAHAAGMAALRYGDHQVFGDAIRREREILLEQRDLIRARLEQLGGWRVPRLRR